MRSRPMVEGASLLERAIGYALGSLRLVAREDLYRATPCHDWDVGDLLAHLDDSLTALTEAADLGQVDLGPAMAGGATGGGSAPGLHRGPAGDVGGGREACRRRDPVLVLRDRAAEMLGAWARQVRDHVVIEGCPMAATTVSEVGAVEVAVHAWDLARACGRPSPMPPLMAGELLDLAQVFVTDADRPARFAGPIAQPRRASAQDRLLAFLGRDPGWGPPHRFQAGRGAGRGADR
ncbi:maleylpyruvate isomerase family mycothiol-dependent enzyme [Nonomuraea sp. NPDC048916]|uniref:maleylpyruvate isomerase family mycothiol-dependent enzyme n=1 Tax=Nonomuraea sp. NPDC048916 TaxID=3154232 RepID=UPI0033D9A172